MTTKFNTLFTKRAILPELSRPVIPNSTQILSETKAKVTESSPEPKVSMSIFPLIAKMTDKQQDYQPEQQLPDIPDVCLPTELIPTQPEVAGQCEQLQLPLIIDDEDNSCPEDLALSPITLGPTTFPALPFEFPAHVELSQPSVQAQVSKFTYLDPEEFTSWTLDPFLKGSGNSQRWPAPLPLINEAEAIYPDMFALQAQELPRGPQSREIVLAYGSVPFKSYRKKIANAPRKRQALHSRVNALRPTYPQRPLLQNKQVKRFFQPQPPRGTSNLPVPRVLQQAMHSRNPASNVTPSTSLEEQIEAEVARRVALLTSAKSETSSTGSSRKRKASSTLEAPAAGQQRRISPHQATPSRK